MVSAVFEYVCKSFHVFKQGNNFRGFLIERPFMFRIRFVKEI